MLLNDWMMLGLLGLDDFLTALVLLGSFRPVGLIGEIWFVSFINRRIDSLTGNLDK